MTDPYLIACLDELRSEFNHLNPSRDKGSDGWIGDKAHQDEVSDHNPDSQGRVLAIDIDSTGPWPDSFDDYVMWIVNRCRNGEETRIEYIIRNRKIYERHNEFAARDYDENDPHTGHAHFSARHDHTGQNSRVTWGLDQVDMPNLVDIAQACASKLAVDLRNDNSGISLALDDRDTANRKQMITDLYLDLHREPDTTDPAGQSGLNKLIHQIVREEIAAALNPPAVPPSA